MKYVLIFLFALSSVFAQSERQVVAAVIIKEAGGEGKAGMQAVANVIQNRMRGKSAYQVVTKRLQFSCLNGIKDYQNFVNKAAQHSAWQYALELSEKIENKSVPDITQGSTHYHTDNMVAAWDSSMQLRAHIGHHLFYKEFR